MIKYIFLSICAAFFIPAAAIKIDIQPGQLADKIGDSAGASELVITGRADARDLATLRTLPSGIKSLDLSGLSITALSGNKAVHLGKSIFSAGNLPAYILFKAPYSAITLPADLKVIEAGALAASDIEEIIIPEGVTSIGEYAFYGCHKLRSVALPSSLLNIGRGAFGDCPQLNYINLEATRVTILPEECFAGDIALRSFEAPGLRSVETRALAGTSIETLELPAVESLAPFALADMPSLVKLSVGNNARFSEGTLMNCKSLISLSGAPENVPDLFAANCYQLLPDGMLSTASSLGKYSLANISSSNIVFGPEISSIDENAFKGTLNLKHINAIALKDNVPSVEESSFSGINPSEVDLKVADGAESAWQSHPVWSLFNITSDALTAVENLPDETLASQISVRIDGNTMVIEAPSAIIAGAIYDSAGSLLFNIPAGSQSANVDISNLPHGVAIVSVKTADDFKGIKVIL